MDWNLVKTLVVFDNDTNKEVARFPFIKDDPNHGLPDWVFGLHTDARDRNATPTYLYLETDDEGTWGWTPAMGPAPCWTGKADSFEEAITKLDEWLMDNF